MLPAQWLFCCVSGVLLEVRSKLPSCAVGCLRWHDRACQCPGQPSAWLTHVIRIARISGLHDPHLQVGDTAAFQLLRRSRTSIIPLVIGDAGISHSSGDGSLAAEAEHLVALRGAANKGTAITDGSPRAASAWSPKAGDPPVVINGIGGDGAVPDCNRFAKFTAASDAAPLWRRAAQQLAAYAAQVGRGSHAALLSCSVCHITTASQRYARCQHPRLRDHSKLACCWVRKVLRWVSSLCSDRGYR